MTRTQIKSGLFLSFFIFFISFSVSALVIEDDYFGYSLDIPEGFQLTSQTDDGLSYLFTHPELPVELAIRLYINDNTTNSNEILNQTLDKLNAQKDIDSFFWNSSICSISSFKFNLQEEKAGWSVCSPTVKNKGFVVLLCYAPASKEQACEKFIISTINSLCIEKNYHNTPGIITTYAFPSEGKKNIQLKIADKKINTSIDNADIEAAQFVIDTEYSVLKMYAKHKLWKEAWIRYYRLIYRDNYGRLNKVSSDIKNAFREMNRTGEISNFNLFMAQSILSWTQNFEYQRAKTASESDFTSLPAVLCGTSNDCDSRSMLICVLMNSIGIDSIMLFSPEYSHAIAAIDLKEPGQTYTLKENNKNYLVGETTAKITWGIISSNHADKSKWIPVIFN